MPSVCLDKVSAAYAALPGGTCGPAQKFLAELVRIFKPEKYGIGRLINDPRSKTNFDVMRTAPDAPRSLFLKVDYPTGLDRTTYTDAYECYGAALICQRLISEYFPGCKPQIAELQGVEHVFSVTRRVEVDAPFTHYVLDVTGFLSDHPGLKKPLEELGITYAFLGRTYLDPIPCKMPEFSSARILPEEIGQTECYGFLLNAWNFMSWPKENNGIRWSGMVVAPSETPVWNSINFAVSGALVCGGAYTPENFAFGIRISPQHWKEFSNIAHKAPFNREALLDDLMGVGKSSLALSAESVRGYMREEGLGHIFTLVRMVHRALENFTRQMVYFDGIEVAPWLTYLQWQ